MKQIKNRTKTIKQAQGTYRTLRKQLNTYKNAKSVKVMEKKNLTPNRIGKLLKISRPTYRSFYKKHIYRSFYINLYIGVFIKIYI